MDLLIGTAFLILVLVIFTLFTYKAPNGMRAMGALANAAIATFLVEAFNKYVGGRVFHNSFLEQVGTAAGDLGGVAAAGLTCLRSLSSRELENTVPGEMDLSAEGKSIGLGVRPACVSHPGSATTGYVALGKWLNIIHM